MNHAQLADIEAAIAHDESTNPSAYYEYQGTIDEAHTRRQLTTSDVLNDRAFLAPDGKWITEHSAPTPQPCARCWANPDTDLPTGGPTVNYGAAGI